jgi:glycosyltransferase involved in cell wall biosynthesis
MLIETVAALEKFGVFCAIRASVSSEEFGAKIPIEIKSKYVQCPQPEEYELMIRTPFEAPTPGKKTFYWTMWESTLWPKEYIEHLNNAHHVIVPTQWNADGLKKSGLSRPISIVPLGISREIFSYIPPRNGDKLVFGAAGRLAHGQNRKGIPRAMEIFSAAFPTEEDVELQVKLYPDCKLPDKAEWLKDERIVIQRGHLDWLGMRKWFADIDVFLSLARVEGWGLWQLQSMACGRPVMAAPYAGIGAYLNEENGFCLPFTEVHNSDYGGGKWAEVSDDDAITMLRSIYENRGEIQRKGLAAAERATHLTWDDSALKLIGVMEEAGVWR